MTRRGYERAKRAFDVVLAVAGGAALAPLLAVITALQLLIHGRPVLFPQARVGRYEVPFVMLKFRSMRGGPGPDGNRLTAFGRFLRRSSIDELPQLVNVLRGEMSLVGPRPTRLDYVTRMTPGQRRRHEVPPGITCIAQVSGRNALSWQEKFQLDVEYVERRSLGLDLALLARTVGVVLGGRGVTAAGVPTGRRFAEEGARIDR